MRAFQLYSLLALSVVAFSTAARAEDYVITLKNHEFSPKELTLPANQKVKITVKNASNAPAEFESSELDREKVVKAGGEIVVNVGPLDPGTYPFHDDFHDETTGTIIVK